jgi:histidinol phosphatase-like PHP family hydrolase
VKRRAKDLEIDNSQLAEWLSREADNAKYPVQRALRAAGRAAFLWPEEVSDLVRQKRRLSEIHKLGPFLEKQILNWIENPPASGPVPEIRRDFFTWSEAQKVLEDKPDWRTGIKGDLQMHTEWSDGSASVREMADAAVKRGYQYIAITDHGKKLKIAGGITEAELREQGREIDEVNQHFEANDFRVLRSIEMNLDVEGNGDMDSDALAELDLVLGAFHSSLRKTEAQTERYLGALKNPNLNILGHPRGRIYNYRLGLSADWERVFGVAAELDKAVEIDSYPDRQDLSLDLLKLARKAGVRISIGTDAHHPWQLEFIDFGLAAAVAAGIPKERILNFMSRDELLKWAGKRNKRRDPNICSIGSRASSRAATRARTAG